MNVKRFFRGPLFWILLAVVLVLILAEVASQAGGYEKVDTSVVFDKIRSGEASQVTLVDRDQEVRVETTDGDKIKASYIEPQGSQLAELVEQNPPPDGQISEVPTQSVLVTILFTFGPIILILLLLFFFMNQMQG